MAHQKVSKAFNKKRKEKQRFAKKILFADAHAGEDRSIMSRLEEEFERKLRSKIIDCKRNNGNLDVVLLDEYNRDILEKGLVSKAEKAAGFPKDKIEKYLIKRKHEDRLTSSERYSIYVINNFHRIVSEVEVKVKIENPTFFGKYKLNTK